MENADIDPASWTGPGSVAECELPHQGRVLVVDDDDCVRLLVAEALRRAGYLVEVAFDGEAGWAALNARHFDLLITDQDMPKLRGLDLLRRVRGQAMTIPALLISGNMPVSAPDFATLLQPGGTLDKPFSLTKLLATVGALMPSIVLAFPRGEASRKSSAA